LFKFKSVESKDLVLISIKFEVVIES